MSHVGWQMHGDIGECQRETQTEKKGQEEEQREEDDEENKEDDGHVDAR